MPYEGESEYCCCQCGRTTEEAESVGTELVLCAASGLTGNPDHWFCLSHPHETVGMYSDPVCSHQCWLDWGD